MTVTVTTSVLPEYLPEQFSKLPSIERAALKFSEIGGLSKLDAALTRIAKMHPEASRHFGIQLLHRHADLTDDEVLLAYGNATIPVDTKELSPATRATIQPTVWGLRPDCAGFAPLEFVMGSSNSKTGLPELDVAFAQDLALALLDSGLERVFGIGRLSAASAATSLVNVESTHDRANVLMPEGLFVASAETKMTEVLWRLDSNHQLGRICQLRCKVVHGTHRMYHKRLFI
ncbi:hypothetical protein V8E36_007250 [Tilletia maclaganii]